MGLLDKTKEELVSEIMELRLRLAQYWPQEPHGSPSRQSRPTKETTEFEISHFDRTSGQSTVNPLKQGTVTQTIDLSKLFTTDLSDTGSFDIGSGIWGTTFGKVLQALPVAAFLIDKSSRIVVLNEACHRITSDYRKLEGTPFADLFATRATMQEAQDLLNRIFVDRKPREWEAIIEADHRGIWVRLVFRPIRIVKERFLFVLIEDLTSEKEKVDRSAVRLGEMERMVRERTRELTEINERLLREVSQREETERTLRETGQKYRELAELLPQHVFEVDEKGFFTFSNHTGSQALGYAAEELEGREHMLKVLAPPDHPRAVEDFKKLRTGEKISGIEYTLARKDGSTFEVMTHITPLMSNDWFIGARGVAVDISELKRVQRQHSRLSEELEKRVQERSAELLAASEKLRDEISQKQALQDALEKEKEKLSRILEAMEDGVDMVDEDYNIQFINRALLEDLGSVEGRKCYQYFHDRSEPCPECHMPRVAGGKSTRFEWHCAKNGKTYELRDSAVHNADGSIWKVEIFRDVTMRKKTEAALKESERRYRELVENASDVVFEVDAKGSVTFVNLAAEKLTGLSRNEFVGKHYLDFVPQEFKKQVERFYGIQLVKRQPDSYYEYPMIGKDGGELWLGQRVHLVTRDEEVVGFQAICRDITERHCAEERLRESEARFRELSELLPQLVFEVDDNLKFTFINRAGIQESGYTEEDVYGGLTLVEFVIPEDRGRLSAGIMTIREGAPTIVEEYSLLRKDGSTIPAIMYASQIVRDGSARGIRGVAVDITDRKRAEAALTESEEKFRNLVERANDGIVILQAGIVKYANPAAARALGYEYLEELDQPFIKYFHPMARARMLEIYKKRMAGEEVPTFYDTSLIRKDGDEIVVEVNAGIIDFSGQPADLVIMRDVTERRRIEAQLEESELKFRSVVENAQEGITVIQGRGLKYVNQCTLRIMGYTEDEMISRPFLDFIHPDDRKAVADRYRRRLAGESFQDSFLLRIVDSQGLVKWIEADSVTMDWGGEISVLTFWRDVTERKKAEEALRQSEGRFRALFENMINGVAVYRPVNEGQDFVFIDLNKAAENIERVNRDDIIGKPVSEAFPGVNEFGLFEVFQRVWRTGQTEHYPVAQYKDERIEGWRDNVVYKLPTGDIVAVFSDETERKKAEDARRESENRYKAIVDNAPESMFLKDRNLRYTHVNPAMERLFGLPSSALVGKTDIDLFGEDAAAAIHLEDEAVLRGRTIRHESTKPVHGVSMTFDVIKVPISDSAGTVVGVCGIARDVTEKRKAEEQIRLSEEKYRTLFNNSRDGIYITTRDGQIEEANPAFGKMFGLGFGELRGLSVLGLYEDPSDRRRFQQQIEKQGSVRDFEIDLVSNDGRRINCLMTSSVRRDHDGAIVGYEGSIRDVTDRKVLEQQLFLAQKMEAIGTLAGGIAHDFNNILYVIIGFTELAQDDADQGSSIKQYLSQVLAAGERAKYLVNQILTFSRQTEQEKRPVLITPIVKEVCRFLRASLPTTIAIHQELAEDLSPILGDPTQIHQVLMNLCTNAGHAMREAGGELTVSLREADLNSDDLCGHPLLMPGRYQELTIGDNGHGIDQAVMDRIFEPYFTTKEKGEGTGLGLAVVHGIVKSHGGMVRVQSESGKGSVFRVHFPVVQTEVATLVHSREALRTGHERILVIDDEEPVARMFKLMLERLGYKVLTRTSSIEAMELFRSKCEEIDLVITDMTMPNMTGKQLAEEMIQVRRDIPIILCTGFSDLIDDQQAKAIGIKALVMKPVLRTELTKTIRGILDTV